MFERVDVELAKAGEVYEVTFAQKAMMQGGEYMMSLAVPDLKMESSWYIRDFMILPRWLLYRNRTQ